MASFQGHAEVLSAKPYFSSPAPRHGQEVLLVPQDDSSNVQAIQGLFAIPDACDGSEARPQKRRKVEHRNAVVAHQPEFDDSKSIILAKISLDLVAAHVNLFQNTTADVGSEYVLSSAKPTERIIYLERFAYSAHCITRVVLESRFECLPGSSLEHEYQCRHRDHCDCPL